MFLFIAHDLDMVEFLCDRVGVMYHGKLVETGPARAVFENPLHPYTKALIAAIPIPDPRRERARAVPDFSNTEFFNIELNSPPVVFFFSKFLP